MPEKRLLGDWLAGYLDYTADLESPESLHRWIGLCLLACASRRKVFLDMEYGLIFPNLYVIIVAESAKVRKSVAMDHGRDLLLEAIPDIRIMRDSMTSQGLIKILNHKVSIVKEDKIVEELRSDVAIFADEVANLFSYERTRASQMVIFLTRTYGCPTVYDHTTVRDSLVRLHNLYPVLLGGTDPHNLKVLPEDAIGGLTGRLIWVVENTRRKNNPGWKHAQATLQRRALREYLIHDLQRVGNLQGEATVAPDAQQLYDVWYEALSSRDTRDPETDAFYHRCHVTALRIALLLSMAQRDDLVVDAKQMAHAIKLIELQLPEVKRVVVWSGSSQYEQSRAKLIRYMQNIGGLTTRRVLLKHMGMGAEDFDKLVSTLVQDGTLKTKTVGSETAIEFLK